MPDYEAAPEGGIKEAGAEQTPAEPKKDDGGFAPAPEASPEEVAAEAAPEKKPAEEAAPESSEEKPEESEEKTED